MTQFTNKTITNEEYDAFHKVVLDGISDNVSAILYNEKYGTINTAYPTTMGYYVVNLLPETYTLKYKKTVDKRFIKAGELIVKTEYLSTIKDNTNWYRQQLGTNERFIIENCNIVHACLDV